MQVHFSFKLIQSKTFIQALFCGLFAILSFQVMAQVDADSDSEIEIIHADDLIFEQSSNVKAMRLIGHVKMKQNNTILECDSAYFYSEENRMNAFGNVYIHEGDSVKIYGDYASYDGATQFAKIRKNVSLFDGEATLNSDYLDYDRKQNFAYYKGGGHLKNPSENIDLTSQSGYFYPSQNLFQFIDSVEMKSDDFYLKTDSLRYNRLTNISHYFGKTKIIQDNTTITCFKGKSDRKNNTAYFVNQARIVDESQDLSADSIYVDNNLKIGISTGNVSLLDTTEKFILQGDYAYSNQKDSTYLVHTKAQLIQYYKSGDSLFLHGDTLYSFYDSTRTKRIITAFYRVKLFRNDMQGKCDSLVYTEADSLIKMFGEPIIWSEENQITANYLQIFGYEGQAERMDIEGNAFICSQVDSLRYNQIEGDSMIGYFEKNELHLVKVFGNGKTLYYVDEEEKDEIGLNIAKARNLDIYLDSSQVDKILFFDMPDAVLIPAEDVGDGDRKLNGFVWHDSHRPKSSKEIFIWHEKVISQNTKKEVVEEEFEGGKHRQRAKKKN